MSGEKKYALLDTDFIYKTHLARNTANRTLADLVMDFDDYEFFCHDMIKEELTRHEIYPNPLPWLEKQISQGRIRLYSDGDILEKLCTIYKDAATFVFVDLLKNSCDIFNAGFFEQYYIDLAQESNLTDRNRFLLTLRDCDERIPHQHGIGEKKSYVLLQMMRILYDKQVYVFCSDDFHARQSIASLPGSINCLSILGVFYILMRLGFVKSELQEYYLSLAAFLKNQTSYRVWSSTGHQRLRVPIRQVLDDIYDSRIRLLKNGDLQYIDCQN